MKLLTESQKSLLQGHAIGLNLPSDARVYLAHGIPTVFRLANAESDHAVGAWLHIPGAWLTSMKHSLVLQGSKVLQNHIARTGIETDDLKLYPVLVAGEVEAVITVGTATSFEPDPPTIDAVLDFLSTRYADTEQHDHHSLLENFLDRLFVRDRSYDEFQKAVLELMTEQWPGSLGAIYYRSDGVHKLRLAVGDIYLSDRLEGTLKSVTAQDWADAIRRKQFFLPADMMPDYPVPTDHPPNYMFLHPGIMSDRTEYMSVVLIPGDIGRVETSALRQIARIAGHLHESQFSTVAEVSSLYALLAEYGATGDEFKEALIEAFRVINHQVPLSRMVLARDGSPAEIIVAGSDGEPTVRIEPQAPIPAALLTKLDADNPVMVPDVRKSPCRAEERESYLRDNVASEILLPVERSGDGSGYVAFGSPHAGRSLDSHRTVLEAVAKFLWFYNYLKTQQAHLEALVVGSSSGASVDLANDRLNTVAKLAGGYFHDLMEHLSVVVGQNEIIESAIKAEDYTPSSNTISNGSAKVRKAANQLATYLGNLRDLCLLSTDQMARQLSSRQLLEDLPTIVRGHATQVKDSKNVTLTIEACRSKDNDFELTYREVYDYVLPFVLGLMDEAICSGSLLVSADGGPGRAELVFEFATDIIGHSGLGEMIARIYSHQPLERRNDDEGIVHFEDATLSFGMASSRTCHAVIRFAHTSGRDIEQSTINRLSPNGEGLET
jgi:GAF domain-containing protein